MNAYEFGQQLAALEKEAINWGGVGKAIGTTARQGAKVVRQNAMDAVNAANKTTSQPGMLRRFGQRAQQAGQGMFEEAYTAPTMLQKATGVGREASKFVGGEVGRVGLNTANAARRGLNKLDDMYHSLRGTARPAAGPNSLRIGNRYIGRNQLAARDIANAMNMPGVASPNNPLNPFNVAVGTGALAAGYKGTQAAGNALFGSEPTPENVDAQQMNNQLSASQHAAVQRSPGLLGMWNSLPIEARYAIGAGVPLALAGAFMGGRGNTGLGAGMGALGLGAAGLGAAGAGLFGDGARRMVGQGANGLYSMLGGGGGNPMDQINALSQLSPEFGSTMLMGRDPNMSSGQARQMYDFLTHNRNIIEQLMPQLQNASTTGVKQGSALEFGKAAGRCWTGYEPVPGKKPYSNDSCRPVGSKKKDKKEKKAVSSAPRGKTEMSCTPSARGSSKIIDDKQRSAPNPVPTDAANTQQADVKAAVASFEKTELPPANKPKVKPPLPIKKKVIFPSASDKIAATNIKHSHNEKTAGWGTAAVKALAGGAGQAARGAARGVAGTSRTISRGVGAAANEIGGAAVNRGAQMARGGAQQMMRGGVGNAVGGGIRAATGAGMYGAGQVARGAGNVARWAGTQVPGSTAMNAARTAVAMPIAAGATYGAYRATAPAVDPYISSAQQFGSDVANRAGEGLQQAGQAAMAVPRAIGQGVHNAGSAMGDAVGTAYGTARNAVVNTANDVRRGVNNAVQTARSYVPNVRNPFYYGPANGQPNQMPGGVAPLQSGRVSDLADL